MRTFSDYLESNYGALQTDSRINLIKGYIKSDIKERLRKLKEFRHLLYSQSPKPTIIQGNMSLEINTKYKEKTRMPISINWRIKFVQFEKEWNHLVFGGGYYYYEKLSEVHAIILVCNKDKTKQEVINNLDEGDKWLSHEIKHMLDEVDKIFTKKKYQDNDNFKKYVLQDSEINAFLITIIEDLKNIKLQNKNITFDEALKQNKVWQYVKDNALKDSNKFNKFKGKLAYFWNKNTLDKTNPDINSLKQRLIRYLYNYHKNKYSLKQIKDIASRFNSEKEIMNAIEYLKKKL